MTSRRTTLGPIPSSMKGRASMAPSTTAPAIADQGMAFVGGARRASVGVAAPRKSSIQPKSSLLPSSTTRIQDPRNINDKTFIQSSIRQLVNFLTDHNYDQPISPKILSRPSNRDFNNIVMFILKQFDPNLQFNGKFEDDLIAVFKLLGYPCQLPKSHIGAAGTPHAWPTLLAALVWLIDLKNYDEAARIGDISEDDESNGMGEPFNEERSADRVFQRYLRAAYPAFIAAQDDKVTVLETDLVGRFDDKHMLLEDEIRSYEQRLLGVNREIESIEAKRNYLPQLEQKLKDYAKDKDKFEKLISELIKHKDQLQTKANAREAELEKLVMSIGTLNGEIQTLKDKIATQELSPEDVKRMQAEHTQLQQSLDQASEQRQASQRRVWELEMALRDKVQALDDAARSYNLIAEDLKLVPSTARNARGKHLSIEVDVRAKKRDDLLRTDVHEEILPTLQTLKLELNENTTSLKNELLTEQEANEEIESSLAELEEQFRLAESKLKRMEEANKREKEAMDLAFQAHTAEKEDLESQLAELRDTSSDEMRLAAISRKIEKLRAERELRVQSHVEQKVEMMNAIMDVVTACAAHRENVQTGLGAIKDKYASALENHLMGQLQSSRQSFVPSNTNVHVNSFQMSQQYQPQDHHHQYQQQQQQPQHSQQAFTSGGAFENRSVGSRTDSKSPSRSGRLSGSAGRVLVDKTNESVLTVEEDTENRYEGLYSTGYDEQHSQLSMDDLAMNLSAIIPDPDPMRASLNRSGRHKF